MTDPTTRGPPADGGYPLDCDLHQMSDDGGPAGPDPARWADTARMDRPVIAAGRLSPVAPPRPVSLRWQLLTNELDIRVRWRAACEGMFRP